MAALTEQERGKIVTVARSYIGVPWQPQGRSRLGVDCVGLGERAYIEAGMDLEETPAEYRGVDSALFWRVLKRYFKPTGVPLPADLAVYRVLNIAHLALLVPSPNPAWPLNGIHCPINGRVTEARFDPARGKLQGFFTWA